MATSKAKRPILLAQDQRRSINPKANPDSNELTPVKTHVYRTLAELNSGFDKVVHELQTLSRISLFNPDSVMAVRDLICRVRAEANRDFSAAMHEREKANAGHFARESVGG